MSFLYTKPRYDYVAYIDEAGDPGLNRVKPIDNPGSSEWCIVSAVVVRAEHEPFVSEWVTAMMQAINSRQLRDIHFSRLNSQRKELVCRYLAERPVRCFAVLSNKQNMRQHENPWAAQIPSDNWYYCWLTRLLLERVTDFVHSDAMKRYGEPRYLKFEYSERGGLSYSQMNAYYDWLRLKSEANRMFLPLGDLQWSTMHRDLLKVYNHSLRDGLKLADIVASAFFKGVDLWDTRACDPSFAKLLRPRMARHPDTKDGIISGYGVKLMPNWKYLNVKPEQAELLKFYGYPTQWWPK